MASPVFDEKLEYYSLGAGAQLDQDKGRLYRLKENYLLAIAVESDEEIKRLMEIRADTVQQCIDLLASFSHNKYPNLEPRTDAVLVDVEQP